MAARAPSSAPSSDDPVSNALKWVLLGVAVVTFALLGLATQRTYQGAPPTPVRFSPPTAWRS